MKTILTTTAAILFATSAFADETTDQRYTVETNKQAQTQQIVSKAAQPQNGTHDRVFTFGLNEDHKNYLENLEKQRDLYR